MYRFREPDWADPPQPPVAVGEDGIPNQRWLGGLAGLASAAVSITMIVAMVRLVF